MSLVNSNLIKARIYELGLTQRETALALGLDPASFRRKINDCSGKSLTVEEVEALIRFLEIRNPMRYFFT